MLESLCEASTQNVVLHKGHKFWLSLWSDTFLEHMLRCETSFAIWDWPLRFITKSWMYGRVLLSSLLWGVRMNYLQLVDHITMLRQSLTCPSQTCLECDWMWAFLVYVVVDVDTKGIWRYLWDLCLLALTYHGLMSPRRSKLLRDIQFMLRLDHFSPWYWKGKEAYMNTRHRQTLPDDDGESVNLRNLVGVWILHRFRAPWYHSTGPQELRLATSSISIYILCPI